MLFVYLAILMTGVYFVCKMLAPEMAKPVIRTSSKPIDDVIPDDRFQKLTSLLMEKNREIELLQAELRVLQIQGGDYDKVRSLLEDEVRRLRQQNRIFRSELGLPTIATNENSLT